MTYTTNRLNEALGDLMSRDPSSTDNLKAARNHLGAASALLDAAAEAEAKLDREGQRLEELKREVEAASADEQAQAQQQEAEVDSRDRHPLDRERTGHGPRGVSSPLQPLKELSC